MEINYSDYKGSFPRESACPKEEKPEYAFIGRSNVGKSSLINMLTDRISLARVSKKPGKTQMLNFYLMDDRWYLVDLPGYGYAVISKKKRHEWERMIQGYLQKRENLQCAFILIDANIPPQKIDIEFINWMGQARIPFVIVYTKTDRLKPEQVDVNIKIIQDELLKHWNELPQQFISSSNNKRGKEEILEFIDGVNNQFYENLAEYE